MLNNQAFRAPSAPHPDYRLASGWGLPGEKGAVLITRAPRSVKEASRRQSGGVLFSRSGHQGTHSGLPGRLPGGLIGAGSPPSPRCTACGP